MAREEEKIIQMCQEGDLEEFGFLYDTYVKKIYNFIYYKTFHKETAEDLTSQTFTKALENIKKFRSRKGSFSSWVYRIARNTVIDYYRTDKKQLNIEDVWGLAGDEDIERDIDTRQKLEKVQAYLKKLKPRQREIIIMRLWDELSYQQISEIVGTSMASCKMTFSRTIKKLREEMAPLLLIILLITIIKII